MVRRGYFLRKSEANEVEALEGSGRVLDRHLCLGGVREQGHAASSVETLGWQGSAVAREVVSQASKRRA